MLDRGQLAARRAAAAGRRARELAARLDALRSGAPPDRASCDSATAAAHQAMEHAELSHRLVEESQRRLAVRRRGHAAREDHRSEPDHLHHVLAETQRQVEQLREAMTTRAEIARAQGIVMERYGISDEAAFGLLRRISNHTNVKIRDLAAAILGGGTLESLGTGGRSGPSTSDQELSRSG